MRFLSDLKSFIKILPRVLFVRRRNPAYVVVGQETPRSALSRFIKQSIATGVVLLIVTSIAPTTLLETGFSADFFIESEVLPDDFIYGDVDFFTTDDGFVLKNNSPVSGQDVNRLGFTDYVKHTVADGETLSQIADRYGINMETIEWSNDISSGSVLRIGQTLVIPPVDGVQHEAKGGETLTSIAKKYGADVAVIRQHNRLDTDVISKGQKIFVPGGEKPKPVVVKRDVPNRSQPRGNVNTFEQRAPSLSSDAAPSSGKSFIFPTVGKVSQGFHAGHYAIDIGNPSMPDVWAAASGTVVKTAGGCPDRTGPRSEWDLKCNSGYGNHIIVDNGDGWKTLYAHLDAVYVEVGQNVDQGQALGRMGSSGRVYGATGIHLHFECISDGVKINPTRCY